MGPKGVLTKDKEEKLVKYMEDMLKLGHPLTPTNLKMKVAKITQFRSTVFKEGIPGRSWLKWFRTRHHTLVLRIPQALDQNRAKNLCPPMVSTFYENLTNLYNQQHYELHQIWNVDEFGANTSRNGVGRVFAPKGTRSVQTITFNEKE